MSILVTGFGPFEQVTDNASGHLARTSGHPFEVLEVSFRVVDEFFRSLAGSPPSAILLMGVDPKGSKMRLETVAHNKIGERADVRGERWGPGPIDPLEVGQLSATLWTPAVLQETDVREIGHDAGGYLCNYSFFRALQACPRAGVGFIHVPPFEAIPAEAQERELQSILDSCLARIAA